VGDFIRYIVTGTHDLTLAEIERGLKEVDSQFSVFVNNAAPTSGDVLYGSEVYGEIEVNRADDQMLREDVDELLEQLVELEDAGTVAVQQALDGATGMIVFQLSVAGYDDYGKIDPFWDWMFDHYEGLLQVDEEGYYRRSEQILFIPW
jgi:hypothetical protein